MRILVICPHFEPDTAPTGVVMTEIVHRLAERGHELHVVTSLPWYEAHAVAPDWRGKWVRRASTEWGSITRVHPFPSDKTNIATRALGFVGFTVMAGLGALFQRRRPDVVLTMSPPLTLGPVGWVVARLRRAANVFNVQDIFPDVAVEVGAITNERVISVLAALERFVYRRADAVTVLSDDLADNVRAKIGSRAQTEVRLIPNFVDTSSISPGVDNAQYRAMADLGDRTVVMYAGNVGLSQPLELMIDAAAAFADRDDVVFVINGNGSARPRYEAAAEGMTNIRFVDFQPVERLPEVLAAGDIHVIALRRGLARSSVPSKTYSILAAGRPVVASIDADTEVARVITENHCGLAVPPEDSDRFIAAIRELVDDPAGRQARGQAGRSFVEDWVSPAGVAHAYEELFDDLDN